MKLSSMRRPPHPLSPIVRRLKALLPKNAFVTMLTVAAAGLFAVSAAQAAVTMTGDVTPTTDPSTWVNGSGGSGTQVYVGNTGTGTLTVNGGSTLLSDGTNLGYSAAGAGTANIDGLGTTWTNRYNYFHLGYAGTGTVNITNGGSLAVNDFFSGYGKGSGALHIDGIGSTFSCTNVNIGYSGTSVVTVTNGASFVSNAGVNSSSIGTQGGSAGVYVNGPGSTWTNDAATIGNSQSTGTLSITNGGLVAFSKAANVASGTNARGSVIVDGAGSAWTIGTDLKVGGSSGAVGTLNIANGGSITVGRNLYASASQISGDGTINTSGIVGDVDLVFDRTHGATQSLLVNGVTVNLTLGSANVLGVGYIGSGTLTIADGVNVASNTGYLAYSAGSKGVAAVSGTDSKWSVGSSLYVGNHGTGLLDIMNGGNVTTSSNNMFIGTGGAGASGTVRVTNGGTLNSNKALLGNAFGATGSVIVDGTGSKWTNSSTITVGGSNYQGTGTGRLSISNGGAVTASAVSITALSTLTTDVGKGSSLTVGSGTGTITNSGTIRLVAGASAAGGTCTPISYGTLSGNDALALGGIWNSTAHTVTVGKAAKAVAGEAKLIDLSTFQRVLVTDSATGKSVGASFQAAPNSLTFSASALSGTELTSLQGLLSSGQAVLSGWDFSLEGYSQGNPVYLSLFAGSDHSLSDLAIWHYDDSTSIWSKFDASDLAYDSTYASFTVTGFSDYAVSGTAPVPVPSALFLLGPGLAGLIAIRRRNSI